MLLFAIDDSAAIHVVGTDLNLNMVAGNNADSELTHLARKTAEDDVVHIVQLDTERAAHLFGNHPGQLDGFFL